MTGYDRTLRGKKNSRNFFSDQPISYYRVFGFKSHLAHNTAENLSNKNNNPEKYSDSPHSLAKWIWGVALVIFFAIMIFVYSFIILGYAFEFSCRHTISGYLMCLGIAIIPIIGGYVVFNVIRFGIIHQRLAMLAAKSGSELDTSMIKRTPSGRFVKSDADQLFAQVKRLWEENPQSWLTNYQIAKAYDYAGDRPRAREFMQRAVALEKNERKNILQVN